MELKPAKNIICASLFTGLYDVNRNETLAEDSFAAIQPWYESILALKIHAVIFHNNFSKETIDKYQNEFIKFEHVEFDKKYNANIYRYLVYQKYLTENKTSISNVFVTDITDVVVIKNPFADKLFLEKNDFLFCGDEIKILDNDWMNEHSTHLRNNIESFANYETKHKTSTLLNCGIIGGSIDTMLTLMNKLTTLHQKYSTTNDSAFTLDMGAFNFIARTNFAEKTIHGCPVNTEFKGYETDRKDCWFRHK